MIIIRLEKDAYMVRLELNEEVIASIKRFAEMHLEGKSATFNGIGALSEISIGYYKDHAYVNKTFHGDYEVLNIQGNVSLKNGQMFPHTHICFSGETYEAYGGHLNSAIVSATLELIVHSYDAPMIRRMDEETGLFLLNPTNE